MRHRHIVPRQLRAHVQAVIIKGSLGYYKGFYETLLLAPSKKSADYVYAMVDDMKLAGTLALKTSWQAQERETLKRDIADKDVMILRNHGLLTTGRTVGEAFWLMVQLHRACEIQIAAMSGGAKLRLLDEEMQQLVHDQTYNFGGKPNGHLDWIALTRELDRTSPDYAT